MSEWSFPKQVLTVLCVIGVLAAYPLTHYASIEFIVAVAVGAALTTANVLLGYAAIEYSLGKSTATFFKYVLGGMGLRMLFMAVVIGLCIKVYEIDVVGLIVSIGVLYVVFLALEILFIQKKVSVKQQS